MIKYENKMEVIPENALKINFQKIATSLKNKKDLKYFTKNNKSKFKNINIFFLINKPL